MSLAIPTPYTFVVNSSLEASNPIHDFDAALKFASPVLQVDIYKQLILDLQAGVALQVDLSSIDKLKLLCIKSRDPLDVSFRSIEIVVPASDPIVTETIPVYTGMKSTFLLQLFLNEPPAHLYVKSLVSTTFELALGGSRLAAVI